MTAELTIDVSFYLEGLIWQPWNRGQPNEVVLRCTLRFGPTAETSNYCFPKITTAVCEIADNRGVSVKSLVDEINAKLWATTNG